ncbi:MAG: hypothetical protein IKP20_04520 [Candidatus Methanomethylophilaceae archaeon]|nr:hypothetical protein [Candidatus Methanomethylophilaceae archaeon]
MAMARRDIPSDGDGYVPRLALIERLHEAGRPEDLSERSRRRLPGRLTPEEAAEWWDDPSSCDIEGVDDGRSPAYLVPFGVMGRKRKALSRIAVVADRKEAARIKRVLADSFTAGELESMAEWPSLVVSTEPSMGGCTGYYLRRQEGVPVPKIVLEEGTTPDGIVHEAVHHLRVAQARSAFPTTGKVMESGYARLPKKARDEIVRREETETVAETVARTKPDPVESGYYSSIPGADPRSAYMRDQMVISGSKALKGEAAVRAARESYDRTSISRAIISSNRRRSRR